MAYKFCLFIKQSVEFLAYPPSQACISFLSTELPTDIVDRIRNANA